VTWLHPHRYAYALRIPVVKSVLLRAVTVPLKLAKNRIPLIDPVVGANACLSKLWLHIGCGGFEGVHVDGDEFSQVRVVRDQSQFESPALDPAYVTDSSCSTVQILDLCPNNRRRRSEAESESADRLIGLDRRNLATTALLDCA